MSNPILSKGAKVLVTGVNGFIASHIADQLLEDGYAVRGSVRSKGRCEALSEFFRGKYGENRFETIVIKDITQEEEAFSEALEGTRIVTLSSFIRELAS